MLLEINASMLLSTSNVKYLLIYFALDSVFVRTNCLPQFTSLGFGLPLKLVKNELYCALIIPVWIIVVKVVVK